MTPTMLQRLLLHPHSAVFDKDPGALTAFRLNHVNGASWVVADRVLTVQSGNNPATAYSLALDVPGRTLDAIAALLTARGYTVIGPALGYGSASGLALAEGSGSQSVSNGNLLTIHTSLLWSILGCYAGELSEASRQIVQALRQMVLYQAEDIWLDVWGTLYGVPRIPGETDAAFVPRISREAFRLRNNAYSIERAVLDATGKVITIEEPWKQIFYLDSSKLSAEFRFYDGATIGYHLIRPASEHIIDWTDVAPVIERNRAAGVMALIPVLPPPSVSASGESSQPWLPQLTWAKCGSGTWGGINTLVTTTYKQQTPNVLVVDALGNLLAVDAAGNTLATDNNIS